MPYTIVFQQNLKNIIEYCAEFDKELQAIILHGGYGRGEGSWYQSEMGDWRPYNDYDIYLVTDNKVNTQAIKSFSQILAKKIGIRWVDIEIISVKDLPNLKPSIKNYDLKNASKVIYGDSAVLDLIPGIDSSKLHLKEVQMLYFTRLYTLLGCFDKKGLDQDLKGESSRFFRNQMAKAVLAVVDVLLLTKGAYNSSYKKRVECLHDLYPKKIDLLELSRWAIEEKLSPKAPLMNASDLYELYRKIHQIYFIEMCNALRMRFSKQINGPKDIEFCMKWLPGNFLKRIYWLLKYLDLRMEKQISIHLAQSFIAAAWTPDKINKELLTRGVELLRCVDARLSNALTWDEARIIATSLRMEI